MHVQLGETWYKQIKGNLRAKQNVKHSELEMFLSCASAQKFYQIGKAFIRAASFHIMGFPIHVVASCSKETTWKAGFHIFAIEEIVFLADPLILSKYNLMLSQSDFWELVPGDFWNSL